MLSHEATQDYKAEQYLLRREQNLTENMAPSLIEMQENLGPLLCNVVLSQMSPMAQQIMHVPKPLRHTEYIQALTHCDILSIGAGIEEKVKDEQQFVINQAVVEAVTEALELERFEGDLKTKHAVELEREYQQKLLQEVQQDLCNALDEQAKVFQKQKAEADKAMLQDLAETQAIQTQQLVAEAVRKSKQDAIQKCCDEVERQFTEFQRIFKLKLTEALEEQESLHKIEMEKLKTKYTSFVEKHVKLQHGRHITDLLRHKCAQLAKLEVKKGVSTVRFTESSFKSDVDEEENKELFMPNADTVATDTTFKNLFFDAMDSFETIKCPKTIKPNTPTFASNLLATDDSLNIHYDHIRKLLEKAESDEESDALDPNLFLKYRRVPKYFQIPQHLNKNHRKQCSLNRRRPEPFTENRLEKQMSDAGEIVVQMF